MKKNLKSSKINNHYVIYDLETGDSNPYTTEPIEISAIVVDCNTLEKKDVIFNQVVLPTDWTLVKDEALKVNKITREEIMEKGVAQEIVFKEFVNFCRQFQKSNNKWDGLIPVGFNIVGFDNIIMDQLCFRYNWLDNGRPRLFHPSHRFDVMDMLKLWFHNNDELPSYSLDNVREFFGIKQDNAHRALSDVEDCFLIFRRLMEFQRKLSGAHTKKFIKCFAGANDEV